MRTKLYATTTAPWRPAGPAGPAGLAGPVGLAERCAARRDPGHLPALSLESLHERLGDYIQRLVANTRPYNADTDWLKHTLAYAAEGGPRLKSRPVTITRFEPKPRVY